MNKISTDKLSGFVRDTAAFLQKTCLQLIGLRWPQLLLACFAIAMLIVVLPTALFLFILLLIAKFVLSLFAKPEARLLPRDKVR